MRDTRGDVLYVGKAQSLRNRVRSYWQKQASAARARSTGSGSVIDRVADVEVTEVDSVSEALLLEANLIKRFKPRFNVRLKDDKSYPYIKVTLGDDFPRVERTRKLVNDGSRYFGPYASASSVDESMNLVRRLFPFRTCTIDIKDGERALQRPCLLYHIKRCQGPCIEAISKDDYRADIEQVELFLEGRQETLIKALQVEMAAASKTRGLRARGGASRQDPRHRADDGEPEDGRVRADRARHGRHGAPGQPGRDDPVRHPRREDDRSRRLPAGRGPRGVRRRGPRQLPRAVLRPRDLDPARGVRASRGGGGMADPEQFLAERRGGPVYLRVPQRGEKRALMGLAARNASGHARPGARSLAGRPRQDARRPGGAGRGPGPARPAPAHRVLRHLQLPGRGIRRQHGRVRGRQAADAGNTGGSGSRPCRARTTSPATRRCCAAGSASRDPARKAARRSDAGRCPIW